MFTDLGTEEGAAQLLACVVAEDSTELNGLLDNYGFPQFPRLGLCVRVREILDSVRATTETDSRSAR